MPLPNRTTITAVLGPLLILPLLGPECDRHEFTWTGYQYIWCRVDTHEVMAIEGFILGAAQQADGRYLYFVEAECNDLQDWQCLDSTITLSLREDATYDIIAWTEPEDRRYPVEREVVVLRELWTCCDN